MGLTAAAYQRMLTALLPPGRLWRVGGGLLSALLLGCADELERLDLRAGMLLEESVPSSAHELLPEYERELDLETEGTDEERLARVVARHVARQRYRPSDLQFALAPILGLAAEDVVVLECTHAVTAAMGDHREIFRFFIFRDPELPGTYDVDSAQALVDQIKPSHTAGQVIESVDFLCDDEHSLCDRDILGA